MNAVHFVRIALAEENGRPSMKRYALLVTLSISAAPASVGAEALPTCAELLDIENHGQHIIRDYVTGGISTWPPTDVGSTTGGARGAELPGGPGPGFHFPNGYPPGASFCVDSRSWHAVD